MSSWSIVKFGNIAEEHEQIKGRPEIREPFGEWLIKKHNLVVFGGWSLSGGLNLGPFYPTLDDIEEFFRIHPSLSKTLRISADTPLQDVISYLTEKSEIANMTANLMGSLNVSAHPIAQGGLADVYHAILPDGAQIAIKCLRHHDTKQVKHTARELNTWSKMKHKNVLELLGLALFRDRLAMVSPWMEYGGVRSVVNKWPQTDRYALCQQLASAVEYLHSEDVVHGDIKGENVLVGKDGQVKLTDFGLSIMHDQVLQFSETDPGGGTGRWMAPELFEEDSRRCRETDVYAMGMTMLEIITGQIPFSELRSGWAVIEAVKINRSTPSIAQLTKEPVSPRSVLMAGVLYRCWRHEPEERATAREVAVMMSLLGPV